MNKDSLKSKKITKATFKTFIKNKDDLYLYVRSRFSGMTDGCEPVDNTMSPVEITERNVEHTYGLDGAWLVGHGGDRFNYFEDGEFFGIQVYNSCGCFTVARKK